MGVIEQRSQEIMFQYALLNWLSSSFIAHVSEAGNIKPGEFNDGSTALPPKQDPPKVKEIEDALQVAVSFACLFCFVLF